MAAAAFTLICGVSAHAQGTVDEKTQLTFSDPVMVPGETLQPGTYTFQVINGDTSSQTVQILDSNHHVVATLLTVPLKRSPMQVKGDTVLRFNPTDKSSPVALKAWFYPGRVYGHQFVYPDAQAREIAQRTKTIVLATDAPGTDAKMGKLFTYDAAGKRAPWDASATVETPPAGSSQAATAPMVDANRKGMRVSVNTLEERPAQYLGKTVSVDAEVDEVLSPRVFKVDEPNWADLDAEMLVYVPTDLAALVRAGDRVTVTGEVKPFARAVIERDFDWLDPLPDLEASFSVKPVLVASRIVGGNSNVAMTINVSPDRGSGKAVGTSGTTTSGPAVTDLATLATADRDLVGRHVDLDGARVAGRATHGRGFWLRGADGTSIFVLPAHAETVRPDEGATVSISGVVLEMPRSMRDEFKKMTNYNDDVYVYAAQVTR